VVAGHLVYLRADGMLMAVPFDVRGRRATGVATPVQDSIRTRAGGINAFLTDAGALVYARGAAKRRLVWVDRAGVITPLLPETREFGALRLSPDGSRLAVVINSGNRTDLWVLDLATGTLTPLTTTGSSRNPSWSPDGRRILYASTHGGRAVFWWQPADGSGPAVLAGEPRHNPWNADLSPDGRTVVFNALYDGTFNLETLALDSARIRHELAASPTATEANGRFSPDGRLVAYGSDESGRMETYVRPFPETGARIQISAAGGRRPVWSPDGRQLYYWQERRLMSATIARDPALRVVMRTELFEGQFELEFDVSRDGRRFLMIESDTTGVDLVVVPHWVSELRRLTAAQRSP